MKWLLLIAVLYSATCMAQVSKVSLQASGLTCSMCSNSIYKALKTVHFVDKIEPNIKTSTFDITFKPGTTVDFNLLKKKVEDAGYAVANFTALVQFSNDKIKSGEVTKVGNLQLRFINTKDDVLNGVKPLKVLNKGFVLASQFKKSNLSIPVEPNVYIVTM